ncbi:MAG TPA: hypothetical protein VH518_00260 [Tepidisphaeraceae bacterium]|jgi:O-glycosyl hydrolase
MNPSPTVVIVGMCAMLALCGAAFAQPECSGWGQLRGIRIDGELVPIQTTLCIAAPGWQQTAETAHWRTRDPKYLRDDQNRIICTGQVAMNRGPALSFRQVVSEAGPNAMTIDLEAIAGGDMNLEGVYFFVKIPASLFGTGEGQLLEAAAADAKASFATTRPSNDKHYIGGPARGARFTSAGRQVEITFDQPREAIIQDDRRGDQANLSLFFPLGTGDLKNGQTLRANVTIKATVEPDTHPATVQIDPSQRGARFAGIGGNFCWGTQSPVVNFYLENLRVTWARVVMPLNLWQPEENTDPTTRPANDLPAEIRESLRMAAELHRRNILMIISVWNAPAWAMETDQPNGRGNGGPRRNKGVNPEKSVALANAIASYIVHFKQVVGVEPELFSFNEPDLGINVRQSPEEHRDFIKLLGGRLAALSLRTKLLLGDAHEPRPVEYVDATLADPEAMKFVGAVSYHSWNGGTVEQLTGWGERARRANLPLFVAEAGTDPDAYHYPAIFDEPWYALDEAAMYLQCLSLSQPVSMLHWQLTPDYGFVRPAATGDSIRLTQRWCNYKQLSQLTPANASVLAVSSDNPNLTVAALAGADEAVSVVHIVNTGGARQIAISGLPGGLSSLRCHVSDSRRQMQELDPVAVSGGKATLNIPAQSFLTLSVGG